MGEWIRKVAQGTASVQSVSEPRPLRERVAALLQDGITAVGTFHAAQRDLAFYFYRRGSSKGDSRKRVLDFLLNEELEHQSETLAFDWEKAAREVDATIRCIYSNRPSTPESRRGLSQREWSILFATTEHIGNGRERYSQLQFLFDLVVKFKSAGATELPIPQVELKRMHGAHSGSYQRRLAFAKTTGLVAESGSGPRTGRCRRFRLLVQLDGDVTFATVDEAIASGDMSFLSSHLREKKVLANVANKHDAAWAKRIGHISNKKTPYYSSNRPSRTTREYSLQDLLIGDPNVSLDEIYEQVQREGLASAETTPGFHQVESDDQNHEQAVLLAPCSSTTAGSCRSKPGRRAPLDYPPTVPGTHGRRCLPVSVRP